MCYWKCKWWIVGKERGREETSESSACLSESSGSHRASGFIKSGLAAERPTRPVSSPNRSYVKLMAEGPIAPEEAFPCECVAQHGLVHLRQSLFGTFEESAIH